MIILKLISECKQMLMTVILAMCIHRIQKCNLLNVISPVDYIRSHTNCDQALLKDCLHNTATFTKMRCSIIQTLSKMSPISKTPKPTVKCPAQCPVSHSTYKDFKNRHHPRLMPFPPSLVSLLSFSLRMIPRPCCAVQREESRGRNAEALIMADNSELWCG